MLLFPVVEERRIFGAHAGVARAVVDSGGGVAEEFATLVVVSAARWGAVAVSVGVSPAAMWLVLSFFLGVGDGDCIAV